MEQAYPSQQSYLENSALGRFRLSTGSSGTRLDFSQLSHHSRTSSNESDMSFPSQGSPGQTMLDLEPLDDQSDLASTISGMSVFLEQGLKDNNAYSTDLEQANTVDISNPNFEYRPVQDALIGAAPFTKPHFISGSLLAPFAGPHSVIEIPLGPDTGKYIHIPHDLRAAEIKLAELAIYWLWSGARRHTGTEDAKAEDFGPKIPALLLKRKIEGPPEAPYSMTESTYPPFLGPRTFILNTGAHLCGWLLHVPRYLPPEEIATASNNLREVTDEVSSWGFKHDLDCTRGVKRSKNEHDALVKLLEQQERNMALLKDVIGLDFAACDEEMEGVEPIWRERLVKGKGLETPKKKSGLLTPTTTIEKNLHSKHSFSSLRSVAAKNVSGKDDLRKEFATPHVAPHTMTAVKVPNAPSKLGRDNSHKISAAVFVADQPHDSPELPTLTRYGVVMERKGELIFEYPLDDPFTSNCEDEQLRPAVVQASRLHSQTPQAVLSTHTHPHSHQIKPASPLHHRNVEQDVFVDLTGSGDEKIVVSTATSKEVIYLPCRGHCCCNPPTPSPHTILFRKILFYLFLGVAIFLVAAAFFTYFYNLQHYLIRPRRVFRYVTENPERRNGMMVLVAIVSPVVVLLLKDHVCARRVVLWGFLGLCGWIGAGESVSKEQRFAGPSY